MPAAAAVNDDEDNNGTDEMLLFLIVHIMKCPIAGIIIANYRWSR